MAKSEKDLIKDLKRGASITFNRSVSIKPPKPVFKIIWDYRSEGWAFSDEDFSTPDDALLYAMNNPRSAPFKIVQIIDFVHRRTE